MTVMTPSDENECRQMLYTAFQMNTPAAVRYPRGSGPGVEIQREMHALPSVKARSGERGRDAAAGAKNRDTRVRLDAPSESAGGRCARRDGRQHAFREAARR